MISSATVVARPCRSIALPTRIGRASQHEWSLIRVQLLQAFECRSRVLHAVDIVYLGVRCSSFQESWPVDAMNNIERHRFGICIEDRRFIHIVPEARDSQAIEFRVQRSP